MAAETVDSLNSHENSLESSNDLEGYDNEFVPSEHNHECPICMMCLRDPYQTDCGHRYCKNCIKRWLRANATGRKCPACNEILTNEQIYPDNFAKREVYSLEAKCRYSKQGCEEQDNLKTILGHQRQCIYSPRICPNCAQTVMCKDMEEHLSKLCPKLTVECQLCRHHVQLSNLDNHRNLCATVTNSCPDCGESLDTVEETDSNLHTCNRDRIRCRFSQFGCKHKCLVSDMRMHMEQNQQDHLLYLAETVERVMMRSEAPLPEVNAIEERIQNVLTTQFSIPSGMKPKGHAMAAAIEFGEEDLKKPVLQRARSLASTGEKMTTTRESFTYRSGEYAAEESQDVVVQLRNQVANQQQHILELRSKVNYLENSLQTTRADVRDFKLDFKSRCCQGNFIWRLKNYQKLRDEAKVGAPNCVLHSPGFYTSFNGYQFCIRLNLNGVENAQGTHLSLFIHLMQSANDDILAWPFTGKVTLTICDQHQIASKRNPISETLIAKPGLAAFQRPTTFRNHKGFGYMEFAPISYLESEDRCFIKDDVLLIKAEVRSNAVS